MPRLSEKVLLRAILTSGEYLVCVLCSVYGIFREFDKLVADAILDCSRRNGIILDAFAGSGTTLIAAERTGRRGYGIELDPRYCDVIVRRLQAAMGGRRYTSRYR